MPLYSKNDDLTQLGERVRMKFHEKRLKGLSIAYLFRDKAAVSRGKVIAGMAMRVDDRNRALHGHDAMVEIAKDFYDSVTPAHREALMDHELAHIEIELDAEHEPKIDADTGRLKVRMRTHDLEEFNEVVERHGAYRERIAAFLAHLKKNDK